MSKETVKVRIFRYNPDTDLAPTYQTYEVPWQGIGNVLQLLKHIYDEVDSTLAFHYYACGYQFCNTCMMMINGKGVHACITKVKAGDDLVLEPMVGYPVIRDLAVDFGRRITTPEGTYKLSKGTTITRTASPTTTHS